jgi:hypothetical protein
LAAPDAPNQYGAAAGHREYDDIADKTVIAGARHFAERDILREELPLPRIGVQSPFAERRTVLTEFYINILIVAGYKR